MDLHWRIIAEPYSGAVGAADTRTDLGTGRSSTGSVRYALEIVDPLLQKVVIGQAISALPADNVLIL